MKGILKTALIVGGLIFVGMLGLKSMGMIWIDSTPNSIPGHWTADESGRNHFVPDVVGSRVAVVQQNSAAHATVIHTTWASLAGLGIAVLLLCAMALFALLGLKKLIHGSEPRHGQDGAVVQELFHLGKSLEARMEALETILLDRTRTAR